MTQLWGPGLDAELEYRRVKLARSYAAGRRRSRRARRTPARAPSPTGLARPRAA